jgi:hypothetical protein
MNYSDLKTEAISQLGDNPTTPQRWTATEVERAVNNAIKKMGTYLGPWYRETTLNVTDASDTYALSNDTTDVMKIAADESKRNVARVSYAQLPTDGIEGQPQVFALLESGPTVTTSKAVVFYPAPDQNYTYIVTEQYQPKADTTDTNPIPVPLDIEDALIYYTCYYLSMKATTSSSTEDASRFLKLAKESLAEMSEWRINSEMKWGRGYFNGAVTSEVYY